MNIISMYHQLAICIQPVGGGVTVSAQLPPSSRFPFSPRLSLLCRAEAAGVVVLSHDANTGRSNLRFHNFCVCTPVASDNLLGVQSPTALCGYLVSISHVRHSRTLRRISAISRPGDYVPVYYIRAHKY